MIKILNVTIENKPKEICFSELTLRMEKVTLLIFSIQNIDKKNQISRDGGFWCVL